MFRANGERILRGRLAVMQELWDPEQGVNAHRAGKILGRSLCWRGCEPLLLISIFQFLSWLALCWYRLWSAGIDFSH
jgi:hypothetical protein